MQDMIHSYWGHPHLCVIEIWKFPNVDTVYVAWDNFTDSPRENHLKFAICQEGNKKMGQTEIFIFLQQHVCQFWKVPIICLKLQQRVDCMFYNRTFVSYESCQKKLPHLGGMYNGLCEYYHIWDCFCTWWTGSSQWTNDKILGFPTLAHRRHLPQNLLNYLSIYWTTSESTELPENLLNYLRIYWTTWEFTELPENLLNYLGNYWTTWKFYWTTWEITELPENFTELPQIFTELPGFLQVQIIVLPGPAEVYYG